jgi:hypothetical protein
MPHPSCTVKQIKELAGVERMFNRMQFAVAQKLQAIPNHPRMHNWF